MHWHWLPDVGEMEIMSLKTFYDRPGTFAHSVTGLLWIAFDYAMWGRS